MRLHWTANALLTTTLTLGGLLVLAAPASADHDGCGGSHQFSGAVTGTLNSTSDTSDSWSHWSSQSRRFTLNTTGGSASLTVASLNCSTVYCSVTNYDTTKSCTITQTAHAIIIIDWNSPNSGDIVNYTLTATSIPQCSDGADNDGDGRVDYPSDFGCSGSTDDSESPDPQCSDGVNNDGDAWTDYPNDPGCTSGSDDSESPNPQCSDGIDNDADGRTDYPADPGCTSITDNQESCAPVVGTVAICLTPTTELQRVTVHDVTDPGGASHDVAGYVETYRFTLPNGTITSLPCVRLVIAGTDVNPCAAAGGVFVNRIQTLVDTSIDQPDPALGDPIATVAICNADLEVTVDGVGVNSTPAVSLC